MNGPIDGRAISERIGEISDGRRTILSAKLTLSSSSSPIHDFIPQRFLFASRAEDITFFLFLPSYSFSSLFSFLRLSHPTLLLLNEINRCYRKSLPRCLAILTISVVQEQREDDDILEVLPKTIREARGRECRHGLLSNFILRGRFSSTFPPLSFFCALGM